MVDSLIFPSDFPLVRKGREAAKENISLFWLCADSSDKNERFWRKLLGNTYKI